MARKKKSRKLGNQMIQGASRFLDALESGQVLRTTVVIQEHTPDGPLTTFLPGTIQISRDSCKPPDSEA